MTFVLSQNTGTDRPLEPIAAAPPRRPARNDDDRPPFCPTCHRRLVILTTHLAAGADGRSSRYQLWGCPRGHATARRVGGSFQAVAVLPDLLRDDPPSA